MTQKNTVSLSSGGLVGFALAIGPSSSHGDALAASLVCPAWLLAPAAVRLCCAGLVAGGPDRPWLGDPLEVRDRTLPSSIIISHRRPLSPLSLHYLEPLLSPRDPFVNRLINLSRDYHSSFVIILPTVSTWLENRLTPTPK